MSNLAHSMALPSRPAPSLALAALMGLSLLAFPLAAARADNSGAQQPAPTASMRSDAAKEATGVRPETVEQRIASLHTKLQIKPDQEQKWQAVARVMRENAATIEKLVAAKRSAQVSENMTALDDLMTYQQFAEAHVQGLRNLTAAFQALYESMPNSQKKVVDEAFQKYNTAG